MADKSKSMKVKQDDGTMSNSIPLGADAENVDMPNGETLADTIGAIDVANDGDIATQLAERPKSSEVYDRATINEKIEQINTTITNSLSWQIVENN